MILEREYNMETTQIFNTLVETKFKNSETNLTFIAVDMEDFDDCRFISFSPENDEEVSRMVTIDFPGSDNTPKDRFIIKKFVKVNEPLQKIIEVLLSTDNLIEELKNQLQIAIDSYKE